MVLGTLFAISGFVLAFTYHEALGKVHTGLSGEVGTHTFGIDLHISFLAILYLLVSFYNVLLDL